MSKNYKPKIKEGKNLLSKFNINSDTEHKKKANKLFKNSKKIINEKIYDKEESLKELNNNNTRKQLDDLKRNKINVNKLIGETDEGLLNTLYTKLNFYFNPIIFNGPMNIFRLILITSLLILTSIYLYKSNSKGVYIVILSYLILYLFFIHSMNVKISCGQNTSLLEIFSPISWWHSTKLNYYGLDLQDNSLREYTNLIKEYSCFKFDNTNFKRNMVKNISNFNTNFNKTLLLNSNYPNNIPSKKYLFLTIYLLLVIYLLISSILDDNRNDSDKGKKEQIINSIILCMIFFIWTCVLDLPTWILIVILISCILAYLTYGAFNLYTSYDRKNINSELLCKPYIIPFVNESWAGITFDKNIKNCVNNKSNSMFLTMMKPYLEIINNLQVQVTEQNSKLNNLGTVVDIFKDKMEKLTKEIHAKIKYILNKILKIKNKIYEIIKNILLMFKAVIYLCINLVYSVESIDNIICGLPFVDNTDHCCFDSETVIEIYENNTIINKKIKDIKINDILFDNSKVIGIIKGKYNNQDMYQYDNIIVTGNHYVYENNNHILVSDSIKSILLKNYNTDYIYCLITSNNKIRIDNIIFSDYFDIDNISIQYDIQKQILSKLNNFNYNLKIRNYIPLWCFDEETNITMKNKSHKLIKNIIIGEETYYGKVNCLVKIQINRDNIYKIKNIITTGDQIIYDNGIWLRVCDHKESEKIVHNNNIFYHLGINTNKLLINDELFTDFEQYKDYGYLELTNLSPP